MVRVSDSFQTPCIYCTVDTRARMIMAIGDARPPPATSYTEDPQNYDTFNQTHPCQYSNTSNFYRPPMTNPARRTYARVIWAISFNLNFPTSRMCNICMMHLRSCHCNRIFLEYGVKIYSFFSPSPKCVV